MWAPHPLTPANKTDALDELYDRITLIATAMGGVASRVLVSMAMPNLLVPEPHNEEVPALRVLMPDGFQVEVTPTQPLSVPFALSVRLYRTHRGVRKIGSLLVCGASGWRMSADPLSDGEIRWTLTSEIALPASFTGAATSN
jgi:hypothetical protein